MKRSLSRLAPIALGLAFAGCVDNNDTLTIVENLAVDRTHTMCTVPGMPGLFIGDGVLDVSLVDLGARGYFLYPLIHNDIMTATTMGNLTPGGMNNVEVNGFDVELQPDPQAGGMSIVNSIPPAMRKFHVPTEGSVITPGGYAGESFEGVTQDVVKAISAAIKPDTPEVQSRVIVHHRATGVRAGSPMTSGWTDFPVVLCRGCLTGAVVDCPATGFKMAEVNLGGCNPSQDALITCCNDPKSGATLCGPSVPMAQ